MSSQITHVNATDHTIEGWLKKKAMFSWRKYLVSYEKKILTWYFCEKRLGSLRVSKVTLDPKGLLINKIRWIAESRRDAVLWKEVLSASLEEGPTRKEPSEFADFYPGHYSLAKAIGRGSYGLVVSARDLRAQRNCAIKKIGNAFADLVDAKRILREIRLMHSLHHPNLLSVYDCYTLHDDIYLVTELLQTDLHDVIYARRPLSRAHVQFFCYQLLRGLEYMHASAVLHRDLKPGNILLNDKCELKICDFGLARQIGPDLTEYVVTRWYRAPELLLSCSYDGAIDLWSLGCVVGEMVERRPLFGGRDAIDQIRRVASTLKAVAHFDPAFVRNNKARAFVNSVEPANFESWTDVVPKLADSKHGIDFLSSLLRFDPAQRPRASDALHHAFLATMCAELGVPPVKPDVVDLADVERCPLERTALKHILRTTELRYTPPLDKESSSSLSLRGASSSVRHSSP